MNLKTFAFRFRAWILPILYIVGFWTPWQRLGNGRPASTLWLAASTLLGRSGWIGLEDSTLLVTAVALCCCFAGAAMRVWATAYLGTYLGAGVMSGSAMHGQRLLTAGPYRYLRNPLYLGHGLLALGISILMPPSGALVFLVALFLYSLLLISAEEEFLAGRLGGEWQQYHRLVPRLLPRLIPCFAPRVSVPSGPGSGFGSEPALAASEVHPRWLEALLAEIFPVGFTLCFAVLAWRYNALILIKSLIVCYGLGLIARALQPSRSRA